MDYIGARVGDRVFYIEQKRIRGLVEKPEIFRVPGGAAQLEGISLFENKLVAYVSAGEAGHCRCGVVFDAGENVLYGMGADELWNEETSPGCLLPVLTGVWVLDHDKTDG